MLVIMYASCSMDRVFGKVITTTRIAAWFEFSVNYPLGREGLKIAKMLRRYSNSMVM